MPLLAAHRARVEARRRKVASSRTASARSVLGFASAILTARHRPW
jgi:hypothetical protein